VNIIFSFGRGYMSGLLSLRRRPSYYHHRQRRVRRKKIERLTVKFRHTKWHTQNKNAPWGASLL